LYFYKNVIIMFIILLINFEVIQEATQIQIAQACWMMPRREAHPPPPGLACCSLSLNEHTTDLSLQNFSPIAFGLITAVLDLEIQDIDSSYNIAFLSI
jgi:hypothetical protein